MNDYIRPSLDLFWTRDTQWGDIYFPWFKSLGDFIYIPIASHYFSFDCLRGNDQHSNERFLNVRYCIRNVLISEIETANFKDWINMVDFYKNKIGDINFLQEWEKEYATPKKE